MSVVLDSVSVMIFFKVNWPKIESVARPSSSSSRGPSSWWLLPAKSFASWQKYTSWWWRTSFFQTLLPPPSSILHQKLPATSEGVFKINFNALCRNQCQLLMDIRRIHNCMSKNENHKNLADQIAWVFIICEVYIYHLRKNKEKSLVFLVLNKAVWMTCRIND